MKSILLKRHYMLFSVLLVANFLHAEVEEHSEEDENNVALGIKRTLPAQMSPQHHIDDIDHLQNEINILASGGGGGGGGSSFPSSCLVPTNVTVGCTTGTSTTTMQSGTAVPSGTAGIIIKSATGDLNISPDGFNTTVNIGTASFNTKTINIGSTFGGSTTTLNSGTGGVQITRFLNLPATTSADVGTIKIAGTPVLHEYGGSNMFVGPDAGNFSLTGASNNALGSDALHRLTSGSSNNAIGVNALLNLTSGSFNNAIGVNVLVNLTSGSSNNAIGDLALSGLGSGSNNIAIGDLAGSAYTGIESNNILISNSGVVGESNTTRIGTGTTATYIAGIYSVPVIDLLHPVYVDSSNQLGTLVSSIRYKENVEDMDDLSSNILDLRPVTFNYKFDENHTVIPGLIAEEVEAIMKSLVIYNKDGLVESVKYHELPVLLLNELKKAVKRIAELQHRVANLEDENAALGKQMNDLDAKLSALMATVAGFINISIK